jgi:hypothetical protein
LKRSAKYWVDKLCLQKHQEGGYYREVYRSQTKLDVKGAGMRNAASSIYYLLQKEEFSAFHRIKSDEIWHFYAGSPLAIHVIDSGKLGKIILGKDKMVAVIKAGCWFAASADKGYSLVGCTVTPGFDYADWEIAKRKELIKEYPRYKKIIERYTR